MQKITKNSLIFSFVFFVFFVFLKTNSALADCGGTQWSALQTNDTYCDCTPSYLPIDPSQLSSSNCTRFKISSSDTCQKTADEQGSKFKYCDHGTKKADQTADPGPGGHDTGYWSNNGTVVAGTTNQVDATKKLAGIEDVCQIDLSHGVLYNVLTCVLEIVLKLGGAILEAAVGLFAWTVDAGKLSAVINNDAIYQTWTVVRNFLNIAFILVLLFSAFATIFQVDKYSYKKTLLWLIIMALLVNFSYPITRFIIDLSNSLMYTILNSNFGGFANDPGKILTTMNGFTDLQGIIVPNGSPSLTQLLASVVFIFILALTVLSMSILFLIRIIALAVIIIFSPVAFVGSIIGKGKQWWDYLFKYAFFGPIMVFMLAVAIKTMSAMDQLSVDTGLTNGAVVNDSFITSISKFIIPIVILWIGMGVAQWFSIAGAKEVTGRAQKFAKWVPNAIFKATGIPGGVKKAADYYKQKGISKYIPGLRGEERTQAAEARIASALGVKGAIEQDIKKRAEEYKKNSESKESLRSKAKNGNAAAAYRLALDGDMDFESYDAFMSKIKDPKIRELVEGKTKDRRVDVIVDYKIKSDTEKESERILNDRIASGALPAGSTVTDAIRREASIHIAETEMGKVAPSKWKDQSANDLLGFDKDTNSFKRDRNSQIRRQAIRKIYGRQSPKNKDKFTDDMNDAFYTKGKKARIW